ncbi:hypothetical protein O1611_g8195 [Lasiodiplodia mahajangana]|uniref:Uncharacterized protein n=1 Tax=Lasiodiplodia mahajangana TaxID=1108764 RepID=A0ACC2JD96_9PEZI|nr:hypothetical protein O1611_g8195 [Lasiodiplodia mahajangana]
MPIANVFGCCVAVAIQTPVRSESESSIAAREEISDDLMGRIGALMTHGVPSEFETMKERAYVTFTCLHESRTNNNTDSAGDGTEEEPTITLLERRNLISGSRTTGHRTWEAALHLGSYLLTDSGQDLVRGKAVLELGAGTGFLAILCAKHLGARRVTTTDGDETVVDYLKENLALNEVDDERLVTGEDIVTYDKVAITALVQTLRQLFRMRPRLQVIIAGVIRNADTFQTFQNECALSNFTVEEITFAAKPMREQTSLFYAAAVPIKILGITSQNKDTEEI